VLSQPDVLPYLLERGLLAAATLIDGEVVVRDRSSRNRNFAVETSDGPNYLLKQGLGPEAVATVANEATIYARLAGEPLLAQYLPRFYEYDATQGVLVLEFIRDAEDLRSHHFNTSRFSAGPAAELGAALGTLHRVTRSAAEPAPYAAAWVLSLPKPSLAIHREISAAGLEFLRVLQQAEGVAQAFARLRETWRPQALVHADIKWDNCLLRGAGASEEEIKLIDWESSHTGDPCWDLGSALSQYLSFWLFSIPVTGELPPERFPELAAYPLDSMKPAITACWLAYRQALGVGGEEARALLLRAVELAAARLVQTAFEAAQMMQMLSSSLVLHLQLANNVLTRPEEAAVRLLGLPLHAPIAA
jgi:hypothetical protein